MMCHVRVFGIGILMSVTVALPASAITLQPGEADSKDVFTYQFLPAFNFETSGPGFQSVLSAANVTTGHNTHTLIAFDLSGVPYTAAQVTQAKLGLYVRDGSSVGFPFANPSPATPVEVQATPLTSNWVEFTVGWGTEPISSGVVANSAIVNGINQWMEIDITNVVKQWLTTPSSNLGVVLTQKDEVLSGGLRVATVFDSASGTQHPYLAITPEPMTGMLLAIGALIAARRSKR